MKGKKIHQLSNKSFKIANSENIMNYKIIIKEILNQRNINEYKDSPIG